MEDHISPPKVTNSTAILHGRAVDETLETLIKRTIINVLKDVKEDVNELNELQENTNSLIK